jgi:hypothetical protein
MATDEEGPYQIVAGTLIFKEVCGQNFGALILVGKCGRLIIYRELHKSDDRFVHFLDKIKLGPDF